MGTTIGIDLKVDNADCGVGQLHEKGQVKQAAEFSVDLNGALNNLVAPTDLTAGSKFEVTVKVGDNATGVTLEVTAGRQSRRAPASACRTSLWPSRPVRLRRLL